MYYLVNQQFKHVDWQYGYQTFQNADAVVVIVNPAGLLKTMGLGGTSFDSFPSCFTSCSRRSRAAHVSRYSGEKSAKSQL